LEGTFKDHLVQGPCHGQGHLPLDQVAQSPIQPGLEHSQGGASTAPLGNLFQCLTTLVVKNFFLISNLNLPSFNLKPLTPCPITTSPSKKSLSSFLVGFFRYWKAAVRSHRSLLFSRLNSPNSLRLSSQERCSSPWIIFVAFSGPAQTRPCLSCAEGSRAECRTPGFVQWA